MAHSEAKITAIFRLIMQLRCLAKQDRNGVRWRFCEVIKTIRLIKNLHSPDNRVDHFK